MKNNGALVIFSKAPVPGKVKTRLIPTITSKQAAAVHKTLLTTTLNTAIQTNFTTIQLWIEGDLTHPFLQKINQDYGIKLYQQTGEDLGKKMSTAFDTVLQSYPFAVLIGSDCPTLTAADIDQAGNALRQKNDIVLGPTEDGGYYLIGLQKNQPQIFENIEWGSTKVFVQTSRHIQQLNLQLALLPKRWDVDTADDLIRYNALRGKRY